MERDNMAKTKTKRTINE